MINSIKKLFKLVEHVDKYSETHKGKINEAYNKTFLIGGGTVSVHIKYQDVPPDRLNESFNILNGCFTNFYSDFFQIISR